ncbi:MAG: hypothetical protein IJU82_07345 [Ruminiclostridium sp.]|nr:hypothetical protein [Ruminiclostridium sp.]
MKLKGKYSESTILHVIILAAAAVISVAVFFVALNMTGGKIPETNTKPAETTAVSGSETQKNEKPADAGYKADKELVNEMFDAATKLIYDNYTVLKLYYTKGLPTRTNPTATRPRTATIPLTATITPRLNRSRRSLTEHISSRSPTKSRKIRSATAQYTRPATTARSV